MIQSRVLKDSSLALVHQTEDGGGEALGLEDRPEDGGVDTCSVEGGHLPGAAV